MTTIPHKLVAGGAGPSVTEKLFAYLDETYGAGANCTVDDYDSREALLDYVIESVSEQDGLTQGCGVGPLMGDIEAWMEAFCSGERANLADEPFCLQVKFDPLKLGYILARNEEELHEHFSSVTQEPDRYPVFARREAEVYRVLVLSYLYYDDMTILP